MKKLIYVIILSALIFNACKETETGGCIDYLAINYESWADYDDGSCLYQCDDPYATNYNVTTNYPVCEYEGDVVFYLDVTKMSTSIPSIIHKKIHTVDTFLPPNTFYSTGSVELHPLFRDTSSSVLTP